MPDPHDQRLRAQLSALAEHGLDRSVPALSRRRGVFYRLAERDVIGLCSNDYLGFADHPTLANLPPISPGSTASRLVAGDCEVHRQLEAKLAEHVGTEDAVLFPSGFQLNVGVLPALLAAEDHAFSDALNHASLIDGLRLAKAPCTVLSHAQSPEIAERNSLAFSWWVTEAIFSMDGDRADVVALARHAASGGCVYLDEAHSFGLFTRGLGLAGSSGLKPTALVCTLGKAIGCAGAFIGGSRLLCQWVRTRARSFVFTTGVSPALALRVVAAIQLLRSAYGDDARERLWRNAGVLGEILGEASPPSPIFPVLVGDNGDALRVSQDLLALGWHVQPIRPPTVADGTARLRITVTAAHTPEQIHRFADDLLRVFSRYGLPLSMPRVAQPASQARVPEERL